MSTAAATAPRILILESDGKTRATLRRLAVKGWRGASVLATSSSLERAIANATDLKAFDVLLVGCDFSTDGTADNPTLRALRALAADPSNPAAILLCDGGSEYTAVQAVKAGAFDYIPRDLLGQERLVTAVRRALLGRQPLAADPTRGNLEALKLFGYDVRRPLARREGVSLHVAFSAEQGKEVVLKVLQRGRGPLARDRHFERFLAEFQVLYDIDDRAVAAIYDFRVIPQCCYMAMEYFEEGHLGTRMVGALEPLEALAIAEDIAHALSIIHAAGIVHRDLKPGNIMLRPQGTVALIDFGIARAAVERAPLEISGTPYYMSPEQARGEATDERTDLYALGVIIFQLLTGEKPYVGDSTEAILALHCHAPVPRLPAPTAAFQPLIDRLLAKDPGQRPGSAREVAEALEQARASAAAGGYAPFVLRRPGAWG